MINKTEKQKQILGILEGFLMAHVTELNYILKHTELKKNKGQ